jgi:hypothetical protein
VKVAAPIGILVVLLACAVGVVWMFTGSASDRMIGTANVAGGVAGVLALMVAVLWPWVVRRRAGAAAVVGQASAATEYLAAETLRYWREQAKDRRITTPSPAAVRWSWASVEVAVPAGELWPGGTGSGGRVAAVGADRGSDNAVATFLPLLETALDRQVLRQAGTVYQFRHAALQDLLATLPADPKELWPWGASRPPAALARSSHLARSRSRLATISNRPV